MVRLSKEAKKHFDEIREAYSISDEAGLLVLTQICEAFDRLRLAQKTIKKEGLTVKDRFDQTRAHPLCQVERDARSFILQGLKALNLDFDSLN